MFYNYENLSVIVDSYKWMPVVMYFIDPALLTGMRWKAIPGNIIPLPERNYISAECIRKKRWIFF